ncbi:MAG: hypothetical protein WCS01_05575 [bacterium]
MNSRVREIGLFLCCLGLTGCGTPRVSTLDPVIRNYADNARAAYHGGQPDKAAEWYGRAMERARLMDAPEEAGRNAYNLALCRLAMGEPEEAHKLLRQAELLLDKPGPVMARVLVADAEAARLSGQRATAIKQAESALSHSAERDEIAQAELLMAEVYGDQGDFKAGKGHYLKALRQVSSRTAPLVRARLEAEAVHLIQSGSMDGDVAACLARRADWLKAAGDYRHMAESLKAAGEAYASTDRPEQAFPVLIRASLSLKAAGEGAQALKAAEQAARIARQLGDQDRVDRATILMEGLGL